MGRLILWATYLVLGTGMLAWAKHREQIDWEWTTVLAPIWMPALALAAGGLVIGTILGVPALLDFLDCRFPVDPNAPTTIPPKDPRE